MIERYIPEFEHLMFVDKELKLWIEALRAIDGHRRNKAPLIKLLRRDTPMPWPVPFHLADLLERYNLIQTRGGKRTPSYDYPVAFRKLVRAKKYYQRFVGRRMNKDTAFERAAAECGVKEETLRTYVAGKYASARRVQKRLPPPKPRP